MLEVGDNVKHKSGGPIMTIYAEGVRGPQEEMLSYLCEWFDTENHIQRWSFAVEVLDLV